MKKERSLAMDGVTGMVLALVWTAVARKILASMLNTDTDSLWMHLFVACFFTVVGFIIFLLVEQVNPDFEEPTLAIAI